nr:hypothetical protein [Avibacterium paragallinarum]
MTERRDFKSLVIGTISLVCAIIFFGGFAKEMLGGIFDFGKLTGHFPEWLKTSGGVGAKGGFLFCIDINSKCNACVRFCCYF